MTESSEQKIVMVDIDKCLACCSCEMACAEANSGYEDIAGAISDSAPLVPRVRVIASVPKAVPVQCMQCDDPPCAAVCPSGALYTDEDDKIQAEEEKCIGCRGCVFVCPFAAVAWNYSSASAVRCDLCSETIEDKGKPACVKACPTGAREICSVEALVEIRRKETAEKAASAMQELPPSHMQ